MKHMCSFLSAIFLLAGSYLFTRTPDIGSNLPLFYAGFVMASVGFIGLIACGLPFQKKRWLVGFLILMVIPRIFALNMHPSDDMARYIWEGKVITQGYNPYAIPPDDHRLDHLRDSVYPMINHKDMPAIYPPLTQLLFALMSMVTGSMTGFRLIILGFEFLCIGLLFFWLNTLVVPRERIILYALNPLVVIGVAGHGHFEPIQILFLILGLLLYAQKRRGWGIAAVTLAGLTKFLGLFALPFLFARKTIKFLPLVFLLLALGYLPFLFLEGGLSLGNMGVYLGQFEYYSLTFFPLRALFGTSGALMITVLVLLSAMLGLWLTKIRPEQAIPPFLLLVTLMNTTVHYWYIIPLIALSMSWRPRVVIGLSLLFMPYFDVLGLFVGEGLWVGALWRQVVTYVPFLFLLWLDASGRWPRFRVKLPSLGIIIPVLNDAKPLKELLQSIERNTSQPQSVAVIDGGSADDSRNVAIQHGAEVAQTTYPSRGKQIAVGAAMLDTDVALVLHADNDIPPNLVRIVRQTAACYPQSIGGACRLQYQSDSLAMKTLSLFSNAKMALFGLSFGDQGQWFLLKSMSPPQIPLMEDVELALRIQASFPAVWTPVRVSVSARRYQEKGKMTTALSIVRNTLAYLIRRRWKGSVPKTKELYTKYYGL